MSLLVKVKTESNELNDICMLCKKDVNDEVLYGKICSAESITVHHYCLLFASALLQKGRDDEGITGFLLKDIRAEVKRGRKLSCSICNRTGATIGCSIKSCQMKFHYPCGVANGMVSQFYGAFNSYCHKHRPVQKVNIPGYSAAKAEREHLTATCSICLDDIPAQVSYSVLWAPCCSKQSWFHRQCLQELALNAGYFFKCPLCSNSTLFCDEMKRMGIYIPEQDASWELEPNAYQELMERHTTCDATPCICPNGKEYDSEGTRWELMLCSSCGSQGVHISCGRLPWSTREWNCNDCNLQGQQNKDLSKAAAKNCRTKRGSSVTLRPRKAISPKEDDSDDSDIDVVSFLPPKRAKSSTDGAGTSGTSQNVSSCNYSSSNTRNGCSRRDTASSASSSGNQMTCSLDRYRFRVAADNKLLVYIEENGGTVFAGSVTLVDPKKRATVPRI